MNGKKRPARTRGSAPNRLFARIIRHFWRAPTFDADLKPIWAHPTALNVGLTDTRADSLPRLKRRTFLRISSVTLGRWRVEGCGPGYRKFGRRVVYALDDLLAWAKEQSRSSTSDNG